MMGMLAQRLLQPLGQIDGPLCCLLQNGPVLQLRLHRQRRRTA